MLIYHMECPLCCKIVDLWKSSKFVTHQKLRRTQLTVEIFPKVTAVMLQQQKNNSRWYPVAHVYKVMSSGERSYEDQHQEILAIVKAPDKLKKELQQFSNENRFEVLTDHKSFHAWMAMNRSTKRSVNKSAATRGTNLPKQSEWEGFIGISLRLRGLIPLLTDFSTLLFVAKRVAAIQVSKDLRLVRISNR